jgi:hypothetical protein
MESALNRAWVKGNLPEWMPWNYCETNARFATRQPHPMRRRQEHTRNLALPEIRQVLGLEQKRQTIS